MPWVNYGQRFYCIYLVITTYLLRMFMLFWVLLYALEPFRSSKVSTHVKTIVTLFHLSIFLVHILSANISYHRCGTVPFIPSNLNQRFIALTYIAKYPQSAICLNFYNTNIPLPSSSPIKRSIYINYITDKCILVCLESRMIQNN